MASRFSNLILWTFAASCLLALTAVVGISLTAHSAGAALEDDMRGVMLRIDERQMQP